MKSKSIIYTITIALSIINMKEIISNPGVMVMAYGGDSVWNKSVFDAAAPLKEKYVTEVVFGMADPKAMQEGISRLESNNVDQIIVVPLFISSYSPIIRQAEYLLGLRKELPPYGLLTHHGYKQGYDTPLKINKKVIMTQALNANPFAAGILFDRLSELSISPGEETVIIAAHGPNDEDDNSNWVRTMDSLAGQIRALQFQKNGGRFRNIFSLTVRDDADKPVYEQAKEQFRSLVYQSGKEGRVIVIPLLLAKGGVEHEIRARLEGLDYVWSGNTLLPHPNISSFILDSVENALK